jgi:tetratricopeptide (TPR) repeat protein
MSFWPCASRTPALAGVFVCALLLLGGCATPQVASLEAEWPAGLPAIAHIDSVPFYPQDEFQCGPAALAMALTAAGVPRSPEALKDQVYLPGREGSLQADMLAATRRNGLPAYLLAPRLEDLLREVAAGHPVVVLQNLSFGFAPIWHYAVVVGFDRPRNMLVLHSGVTERMEMSLFTFERTWERGDYWALLALPTNRLPETAQPGSYAAAVAVLERVNPAAAQAAYTTALQAWPTERALLLGAGNAAYALGQRERAASAYGIATVAHPDFADAWNNLAQVQLELGQKKQAAESIAQAVALGGPRLPQYLELQAEIQAK